MTPKHGDDMTFNLGKNSLKDIRDMIDKQHKKGAFLSREDMTNIYINECDAEQHYTGTECQYNDGNIVDPKTGNPVPNDIAEDIHRRVKLIASNKSDRKVDEMLRTLDKLEGK